MRAEALAKNTAPAAAAVPVVPAVGTGRTLVIEDAAPALGTLSHTRQRAPVVPAVNLATGLIKVNMCSDLVFSGGRRWVRTTGFSLVRRNKERSRPRLRDPFMAAGLRKRWREVS